MSTAVLVDGAFFLRRYPHSYANYAPEDDCSEHEHSPEVVAKNLTTMVTRHLEQRNKKRELYRIFVYDCAPLAKKAHHPVTGELINFGELRGARFRRQWHTCLLRKRKVALRFGTYAEKQSHWIIDEKPTKHLLSRRIQVSELRPEHVRYHSPQKGVDMKLGLDLAALAYRRLVDQIILVTGDSDFVPAAKVARREGIDVILDPMWHPIHDELLVHVDGLRSVCKRPDK